MKVIILLLSVSASGYSYTQHLSVHKSKESAEMMRQHVIDQEAKKGFTYSDNDFEIYEMEVVS